ncbi:MULTISPECIES: IclR family transcriptional regulator [unclassified Microbacterium]|uniref:IclR family transcriptional regulator n=1 Tax=unclassified Microbacterium TaxID=2609290 RepID=UPI000C2C0B94|nr:MULTISPECIES: IclR family transcriptional regulator [unclassified Microbacterium]
MSAVSKATRVLERLASRGELTASDLASQLNEPITTVYRMLNNLESIGWIERSGRKGAPARLGVDLIAIGQAIASTLDLRAVARSSLARLADATSETAYLCVPDGQRAVCIERVDGKYIRTAELAIGGSLPLHLGAGPRAILAFSSDEFRRAYLRALRGSQSNPITEPDAARLESELSRIRETGLAESDGDITAGVVSVAAPVRDHRGVVTASVTLSALKVQENFSAAEAFGELVRREAMDVSSSLGYRDA